MAATGGATTATLGHMLQAGSLPAHTCGGSQGPAVVELVSLRQQDFRPCDFQLAYCVGETPDVRCSEQDDELGSAATVDEEAGRSRSPELHEEASQSTHRDLQPLPKFVVVPPDFDGECSCNVRKMLPPPDNTAPADAMDVHQRFLEEWRRASEVSRSQ